MKADSKPKHAAAGSLFVRVSLLLQAVGKRVRRHNLVATPVHVGVEECRRFDPRVRVYEAILVQELLEQVLLRLIACGRLAYLVRLTQSIMSPIKAAADRPC